MSALQYDLFGEVQAAENADTQRRRDALTCLIEAHPNALELLLGDRRPDTGEIKQGLSGGWAYSRRKDGLYFEDQETWGRAAGAWYRRPAHRFGWDELDAIAAADPRVEEIRAWATSLTQPDAWRDRTRPFELWPVSSWHPSWIKGNHERAGWPERLAAWTLTLAVLRDAREAIR